MAQRTRSSASYAVVTTSEGERAVTASDVDAAAPAPRLTLEPLPARRSSVPPSAVPADTRYKLRADNEARWEPAFEGLAGSTIASGPATTSCSATASGHATATIAPVPKSYRRLTARDTR